MMALLREDVTWEAGEIVRSKRNRAMEGVSRRQRRSGSVPKPSFSWRLRPVSVHLSPDPDETRSIFRKRRRYRLCLPQTPSDSGRGSKRQRLLSLRNMALQIRRGNEDCIPTHRAKNRTAAGMTYRHNHCGVKPLEHFGSSETSGDISEVSCRLRTANIHEFLNCTIVRCTRVPARIGQNWASCNILFSLVIFKFPGQGVFANAPSV